MAILNQVDRSPLEWRPGGGERVDLADPVLMVLALQAERTASAAAPGRSLQGCSMRPQEVTVAGAEGSRAVVLQVLSLDQHKHHLGAS